ncbi:MAG: alpha/beta hydrolase [Bdellovibrionia bacterium]
MKLSLDLLLEFRLWLLGFRSSKVSLEKNELGKTETIHSHIRYFFREGSPEFRSFVVVLAHGLGASASHFGNLMIPLSKAGFTVYALDLPGHGESSIPPDGLTSDSIYQGFHQWMKQVIPNDKKVVLIGNSLGGGIALRYAVENSEQLKNLVLISPAAGFETQSQWEEFRETIRMKTFQDGCRYGEKIYHAPPFYSPAIGYSIWKTFNQKAIRNLIETAQVDDFFLKKPFSENFPQTLVIWGKSEKVFHKRHLDWIRTHLPKTHVIDESEGVGHCPQIDAPEWLFNRIKKFISI